MRSVLVLILVIATGAPAVAAPVRHAYPRHHVVVRPAEDAPVPPGWYKFPGYPPIPPSENRNLDPSNFGGG
ncbi:MULTISPECIES: hypothetical protein [Bradyrhizobium]|uniref:Uncharacterized protein n=1 Tax=Bradyrhizobium arachidis TaxID=858423 RepID=A0AAE7NTX7_9BRAD|nr:MULTISPECIES: hypothetical protein [Bradyrhizobium]QOG17891.1 hypothetical protein FOM02_11620 [Bradyrhizobium sp. SEMIA]QOZ69435.1 hypothetical protein WN72_26315 [Bradyrhizobium arachidis]UFW45512.1 hypothetical protein BaraCB756_24645 [Bradyrhizobium arachidis]SFU76352.1 hypothetical protein SAMN05192541_104366 [Bradyrhizobium arachidis]